MGAQIAVMGIGTATAVLLAGAGLGNLALMEIGGGGIVAGLIAFIVCAFWDTPIVDEPEQAEVVLTCVVCGTHEGVVLANGAMVCRGCVRSEVA